MFAMTSTANGKQRVSRATPSGRAGGKHKFASRLNAALQVAFGALGRRRASEIAFTGDTIGAAEALACGLVSQVEPHDELLAHANKLAQRTQQHEEALDAFIEKRAPVFKDT